MQCFTEYYLFDKNHSCLLVLISFKKHFISLCRFTMCVSVQGRGGGLGGGGS